MIYGYSAGSNQPIQRQMSFSGIPMTGLTMGYPQLGMQASLGAQNPFWSQQMMANQAPNAYSVAQQILAPLNQGAPPGGMAAGASPFGQMAQSLLGGVDAQNPGMGDAEFDMALQAIAKQGQQAKADVGRMLGRFGGSVDPETFARLATQVNAGQQQAIGGLHAQRAGLNREALTSLLGAISPYYRADAASALGQRNDLSGLFANILNSGTFMV